MARKVKKIGLALGSGGARGLAHLGVLQKLTEWNVPFQCVAGTSIGAIIGAAYVANGIESLTAWARSLDWKDLLGLFAGLPRKTGFLTGDRIDQKLREFISVADYAEMPLPFATVATDIATGEEIVIRDGDLLSGVHASFSIPGVFTSVERHGRQLVDGGLVNPLPISVCRTLGAEAVIAVDINLRPGPAGYCQAKNSLNMFDILTNALKFLENEITRATEFSQAPDVCIHPAVGSIGTLDFTCGEMAIAAGREAAEEMRPAIMELLADGGGGL